MRKQDSFNLTYKQILTQMEMYPKLDIHQLLLNHYTKTYLKLETHQLLLNHYIKLPHLYKQDLHQLSYTYYHHQQLMALALLHLAHLNPGPRC